MRLIQTVEVCCVDQEVGRMCLAARNFARGVRRLGLRVEGGGVVDDWQRFRIGEVRKG